MKDITSIGSVMHRPSTTSNSNNFNAEEVEEKVVEVLGEKLVEAPR